MAYGNTDNNGEVNVEVNGEVNGEGGEVGGGGFACGEPEASASLRAFGAVLQALREHAGFSREELAEIVRFSKHTIASIEQGRRMPDDEFVARAEPALGNTGALRRALPHLTRQPGLARWFRRWARLEAEAISLYTYECRLVPGLLQTEAYARAVSLSVPPVPDAVTLDQRVSARLARQELMSVKRKPPTAFSFIVEQAVLERHTGGEDVTRELFDHLLEVIEGNWNVEFQLMPLRQPVHAGLDGPLMLAETTDNRWYVYSEGQKNGRLIADAKEISVLQQRYAKLRSQALTPADSLGLLKRMRGAL
ncbi:helix-turn-helix domain-containing protein [Streptomyces alkaliterrae]|uniref:Helix-turn-helix domain-containing protein n=1 Tax=Streptomyces alkaliterrae TaxID=2213162 RepID=A0A5P0YUX5_9ACTN|nr:helix-turn-helix transcriptional regulator [Streptomyces alkaliterrae]MBB1261173.1 helix-turn-helix domain-containing protein [Streptomyces alkaliterrae]MQS04096.1 helix-turn-helix domain-containing protein [Streptomyces alkaliterrae]